MKYTIEGLRNKFKDKYIDVYGTYNYKLRCWEFEVRSVKDECWENHETVSEIAASYV